MPKRNGTENQSPTLLNGEIMKPSQEYLGHCLTRTALLFSKVLSETELEAWKEFLSTFSQREVQWAFEQWQRNGRFFPKPKEIIELCQTFKQGEAGKLQFKSCGSCEDGWVHIQGGRTIGGNDAGKLGTVERCQCFKDFISQWKAIAAA